MNNQIYNALLELELPEKAIDLYLSLSESDEYTLSSLAESLDISRPYLYKLIDLLESKGLLKQNPNNKEERLQLLSPNEILSQLRDKKAQLLNTEKQFIDVLPGLLESYKQRSLPSKVKIITGQKSLEDLFFQITEEAANGISEYFGSADDFIDFISWDKEMEYINNRIKKNLRMKVLLVPSKISRSFKKIDKKELRETRFFLGKLPVKTGFQLYANKVILWQPMARIAILIEDEYLVAMMKSIFYFCWDKSE